MSQVNPQLITTNVNFIQQDASMEEAVKKMVENKISSLLVHDHDNRVVGILTERDVVHKFTLLILTDKMTRTVGTVMTRPLMYACAAKFDVEIPDLHRKFGIRHFPIVKKHKSAAEELKVDDVVGMVSTTDLARTYFAQTTQQATQKTLVKAIDSVPKKKKFDTKARPNLIIVCRNSDEGNFYQSIFEQLDFSVDLESEISEKFEEKLSDASNVLIEFDTLAPDEQRYILQGIKSWPGQLVVSTAREDLLPVFRKHLHSHHQHVAMKPLNLPHCAWLFSK